MARSFLLQPNINLESQGVTSDEVTNDSNVSGNTVSDALDILELQTVALFTNGGAGVAPQRIVFAGTATTDASGNFVMDISGAGITTLLNVQITVERNTTTAIDIPVGHVELATNTTITGSVITGLTLGALGPTVVKAPAGLTVYVMAIGY